MEEEEILAMRLFSLVALPLTSGLCFLMFTLVIFMLEDDFVPLFLWIGIILLLIGILTQLLIIAGNKKKTRNRIL